MDALATMAAKLASTPSSSSPSISASRTQAITALRSLIEASKRLLSPITICRQESAIVALLELATSADSTVIIPSSLPSPFSISPSLKNLWPLLDDLRKQQRHCHFCYYDLGLCASITKFKIHVLARKIKSELQAHEDRMMIEDLVRALIIGEPFDRRVEVINGFDLRLRERFSEAYQELILEKKVFDLLESLVICDVNASSSCSGNSEITEDDYSSGVIMVKERASFAVLSLVKCNRKVFMEMVLRGGSGKIIPALLATASFSSIGVLSSLVRCCKTPAAVDEILLQCHGELLQRIINLLNIIISVMSSDQEGGGGGGDVIDHHQDLAVSIAESAVQCVCHFAFYGTKEVIGDMLGLDLMKKLLDLRRSTKMVRFEDCAARFALQIQNGKGVGGKKEKEALRFEIVKLVREACVSAEEEADLVMDILF